MIGIDGEIDRESQGNPCKQSDLMMIRVSCAKKKKKTKLKNEETT